jgi:hypothetical protein
MAVTCRTCRIGAMKLKTSVKLASVSVKDYKLVPPNKLALIVPEYIPLGS